MKSRPKELTLTLEYTVDRYQIFVVENFADYGKFWLSAHLLRSWIRIRFMKSDPDPGGQIARGSVRSAILVSLHLNQ
jgi:hypothetical protein